MVIETKSRKLNKTPLDKLIVEFLEHCEVEKNRSALTIRNYDHYLRRFSDWSKERGINTAEKIDLEAVRQYRLYINRLKDERGTLLKLATQITTSLPYAHF